MISGVARRDDEGGRAAVEMIVGIVLVIVAVLEIAVIINTVRSNYPQRT
jgi:hypothetical protein